MADKIKCPICEKEYKSLMSHIKTHGMSVDEFKQQFAQYPLVSETTKQKTKVTCVQKGVGKQNKGVKRTEEQKQALSKRFSGENNPFYGRTHSKETRHRMSENHADFSGDNNPYKKALERDPEKRKEVSERRTLFWKEIKQDPERYKALREKYSKVQAERVAQGYNPFTKTKRGWYFSKIFQKELYYQSSYELQFIKLCESSGIVLGIDRCHFKVPYEFEIERNYIPDFVVTYLDGLQTIIEIKPNSLTNLEINKAKELGLMLFCIGKGLTYEIVTEDVLFIMEETND
jgi:hypothetical protein